MKLESLMRTRRFTLTVTASATVPLLLLFGGTASAADSGWQWAVPQAGCYHAAIVDSEPNGWANQVLVDVNNDCVPDMTIWDTDGSDTVLERLTIDGDNNGYPETRLYDTNQQAGFDSVYFDADQNGEFFGPYAVPQPTFAPTSPADAVIGGTVVGGNQNGHDFSYDYPAGYGGSVVGGTITLDGLPNLLATMANFSGTAAFGSPIDFDVDGYTDLNDRYPTNSSYH